MTRQRKNEIFILLVCWIGFLVLYKVFGLHYPFNLDTWYTNVTQCTIIQKQLKSGIFPLWSPTEGLGAPVFKGSLDLITLPFLYFLSVKDYLVIMGSFYFVLGIYFMYLYLTDEGIEKKVSLAGSLIWSTNGYFIWHLHELIMQSVCLYIPLYLILIKRIVTQSYVFRYWIVFVVINVIQITYGRWDYTEYSLWITVLYIFIVLPIPSVSKKDLWLKRFKLLALIVGAVTLAFLLTAPFTFHYLKLIFQSFRLGAQPEPDYYKIQFLLHHWFPNTGRYDSRGYISLFAFPFAAMALWTLRRQRLKMFSLILILLYIFLSFSPFKLYEALRWLPLHKGNVTVIRMNIFFYFGLTVLFCLGLQEFMRQRGRAHTVILGFCLTGMALLTVAYAYYKISIASIDPMGFMNYLFMAVMILSLVIYMSVNLRGEKREVPHNIFLAVTIVYTLIFSYAFNYWDKNDGDKRVNEQRLQRQSQYAFVLNKSDLVSNPNSLPWRMADHNRYLHYSYFPRHLIESIKGYAVFPPKTLCAGILNLLGEKDMSAFAISCLVDYDFLNNDNARKFASLSSVKYLVFEKKFCDPKQMGERGLKIEHFEDDHCLVQNEKAFERIRFVDHPHRIQGVQESAEFMRTKNLEWFEDNFLIAAAAETDSQQTPKTDRRSHYQILAHQPHHLRLKIFSDQPAWLIINNVFHEDWKLKVDARQRENIDRVNIFFQGFKILPGTHIYDLYYQPDDLKFNFVISLTSLILLFLSRRLPIFSQPDPV